MDGPRDPPTDWRSIREDAGNARQAGAPEPSSAAGRGELAPLRRRRLALYLAIGVMGGAGLALVTVLAVRLREPARIAPRPAAAPRAAAPPAPKTASAPDPAPPPGREAELLEREARSPRAFRTLYEAWAAYAKDAPPEIQGSIHQQMERLDRAAAQEYQALYRPLSRNVDEFLGSHRPRDAQAALRGWTVPRELDVAGRQTAELARLRGLLADLVAFEELRDRLLADFKAGRSGADLAAVLGPSLASPEPQVREEANLALAEFKVMQALGLAEERLGRRREAGLARVEEARRERAADALAERARWSAWEARLKESTQKAPIPLGELGVKDMEVPLRVVRFDGRSVGFAGGGFELTVSAEDLPAELFGRLIVQAADPAGARDLFEAGKIAVRRNALSAAKSLLDRAVKLEPALAVLAPDLARLRGGLGTLRGRSTLRGETIGVRYDFKTPDQAKDFKITPNGALVPVPGLLTLEGERLFWGVPGELKFSGRLRVTAELQSIAGSAGYVLGVSSELTPGEADLFVALIQPDRAFRVLRLHGKGAPEVLAEGGIRGRGGLVELAFDRGRAEFRAGGVLLWTGHFPEISVLQPVVGGNGFQEGRVRVSYRSLSIEGRASAELVRRLESERLTVLESELSKDRRSTREERTAAESPARRSFGQGIDRPLGIEAGLSDVIPAPVAQAFAAERSCLSALEKAASETESLRLEGEIRRALEVAIREAPWFPLTYYYRAEWRHRSGDLSGAMRDLGEAAGMLESFVEAREARADLLVQDGSFREAEAELAACLERVPDLARARLTRALLFYYAGRDSSALEEVELARRLEPDDLVLQRSAKRLGNIVAGPRWSGVVSLETPNYLIRAESPRLASRGAPASADREVRERTQKYAEHLDATRSYFREILSGAESRPRKPLVLVCDTPESYYVYADFASDDRLEHTAGVFFSQYEQLVFFRAESETETLQTMTHEAFHEYLHALVPSVPIWLDEGMAEYVSGATVEGGRVTSAGGLLKDRLRLLQTALERGWAGFPFDFVLGESKPQFYGLSPELQYAQAWSMVHFLIHARGGKGKPLLDRYLETLLRTRSPEEARSVFSGQDLVALQREWRSYVRGLRP